MSTAAPGRPLATIRGTMLVPGVSRNNRLYTREAIARAVTRMRRRITDPDGLPIVMRTHHEAGDNSRLIVGRVTDVTQAPDGSAGYEAKLYNTTAGRDIGALINPAAPALRSTSIHGYWVGPVEHTKRDGVTVETGSDLEVDAIDFTGTPGVPQAVISAVAFESAGGRPAIAESAEVTVTVEPDVPVGEDYTTGQRKAMAGAGQAMTGGAYPIKNKSDLRKAIRAVGRGNASHDAIRKHVITRAKALGLTSMIPDNWNPDGSLKETTVPKPLREAYVEVCVGDASGPLVKVCATNVDPDTVVKAAKKAAKLAGNALGGGGDDDGGPGGDDGYDMQVMAPDVDHDGETHTRPEGPVGETWSVTVAGEPLPGTQVAALLAEARTPDKTTAPTADQPPAPAEDQQKGVAVSDTAKVAEATTPTAPAGPDLAALIATTVAETVKATMKAMRKDAKRTETTETAPAGQDPKPAKSAGKKDVVVKETTLNATQLAEALAVERAKTVAEIREQLLRDGGLPTRKGFRHINETDDTESLTGDDLWNKRTQVWSQFFPQVGEPVTVDTAA